MKNINEIITKAFIAKEIITIDPGRSNGGIVKYIPDAQKKFDSWPIKKMNSFEDLCDFFSYQAEICELPLIFIEKINMYSSDFENRGRMFQMKKLQDHYIELKSAISSYKFKYIEVSPRSWQGYINVYQANEESNIRKRRFKDIAQDWFPHQKIVGWNADAFLLIEFARKKLKYDQKWIQKNTKVPKSRNLFRDA